MAMLRSWFCSAGSCRLGRLLLRANASKLTLLNFHSYELAYKANIEWVVFTCGTSAPASSPHHSKLHIQSPFLTHFPTGSSQGRGPRCASWFLEHVREVAGDNDMQVLVLEGGVKGWVAGGPRFTSLMDGFKPEHWENLLAAEEKKGGEDGK